MSRAAEWIGAVFAALAAASAGAQPESGAALTERSARELQQALQSGALSAEAVTRAFLERIAAIDADGPRLGAMIEINPEALDTARRLDEEFRRRGPVGPLHGLPVAVKANIDTADRMATSAGSVALAAHHAVADAPVVAQLRAAGAVLIGKTNLSEWANFRSLSSTSGWSSLGGQTRNPYRLDRSPCGSSSGSAVAVAARLAPLAVGTETDGSIVCPAGVNGIVGIKPTRGLLSNAGIVPIAESLDVPGPMARTVSDAALLLGAMLGRPIDAAPASLSGVRIGVWRSYAGASRFPEVTAAFERSLERLRAGGAELVDPLPLDVPAEIGYAEIELMAYEFKRGIDDYLRSVQIGPRSLEELIEFNERNAERVMPYFGQELLAAAATTAGAPETRQREAFARGPETMRRLLETLFRNARLDAIVAPANAPAWVIDFSAGDAIGIGTSRPAALSGYPSLVVPAALHDELPLGLTFIGPPLTEERLIHIAAAFEELRGPFPAPRFLAAP